MNTPDGTVASPPVTCRKDVQLSLSTASAGGARPIACTQCHLRRSAICGAVPLAQIAELAAATSVLELPSGTILIAEGEPATDYFIITHGTATIFKLMSDGRRQIIDFAGAGRFVGPGASDASSFSVEAIEPLRVCRFTRTSLGALLKRFPAMERRLLNMADNALAAAQEQMLLLGRKTARERLASFLMIRSRQASAFGASRERLIRLPMSRLDIADYLGLTTETVCRTLVQLRAEGIVELLTPSKLVIRDPMALECLAHGSARATDRPRSPLTRVSNGADRHMAVAEIRAG
jgi:CRP/FNR family transcriptional regulator, anaerobic regulatory protein